MSHTTLPALARGFVQAQKDLKLWLYCLAGLSLFRGVLIATVASSRQARLEWLEVAGALWRGVGQDLSVAAWCVLPATLLTGCCYLTDLTRWAERLRLGCGLAFVALLAVVGAVDVAYFEEFGAQFNSFVFAFDITLLEVVWESYLRNRPVALDLTVGLVAIALGGFVLHKGIAKPFIAPSETTGRVDAAARWQRAGALAPLVFLALSVVPFERAEPPRSSQPASLPASSEPAEAARHEWVREAAVNPFVALKDTFSERRELVTDAGFTRFWPDGDIHGALRVLRPEVQAPVDLDAALVRQAPGPPQAVPRHVFVVVVESYDAWAMLERYRALGLTRELSRLGREGVLVRSFLPASSSTMASLAALLLGMADVGVAVAREEMALSKAFPTSLAVIYRRLGYRTRFFSSVRGSWESIGPFCRAQGFDEVHTDEDFPPELTRNKQGITDAALFDQVLQQIDDEQPSFSVILTGQNHGPYETDVYALGFPLREVPRSLRAELRADIDLVALGHLWNADKDVGAFVRDASAGLRSPLFAITGDHFARKYVRDGMSFHERNAVPLVLWGPGVLPPVDEPEALAGSHVDVAPTLVELAAPEGFRYHSLRPSLLDSARQQLGISRAHVVGADFFYTPERGLSPLAQPWRPLADPPPEPQALERSWAALHAVSWWRIVKGPQLPAAR